jgi:hypothetical protein
MVSRILILPVVLVLLLAATSARAQFLLGVNLAGNPVTIDGNLWQSDASGTADGFSFTTAGSFPHFPLNSYAPVPAVDADTTHMLRGIRYVSSGTPSVTIHQTIPNGHAYILQLWSVEAGQDFSSSADISGDVTSTNFNYLPMNGWEARSLKTGVINDGSLDFTITSVNGQPSLSGFAIFAVPEPAAGSMLLAATAALIRRRRYAR